LNGGLVVADVTALNTNEPGWNVADATNAYPNVWPASISTCATDATWTAMPGSREALPMSCANWYTAYAFCIWDDAFLPTEAEWEYAAAAGSEQRLYPWGAADPGTTNQYAIYDCYYPTGGLDNCPNPGVQVSIAAVGTAAEGAGLWGQLDLAGNLMEWTLDWYAASYPFGECTDCGNVIEGTAGDRGSRGGNFSQEAYDINAELRGAAAPTVPSLYRGFRCARAP
jgi:formylglycine-generating enzyme required for sulfatase activity